jgi:hypothetical protein
MAPSSVLKSASNRALTALILAAVSSLAAPVDPVSNVQPPLASQHDTAAKKAGVDFVNRVSYKNLSDLVPSATAYVSQWLQSFKEYPPRQKPGSSNLNRVMEAVTNVQQKNCGIEPPQLGTAPSGS